MDSDLATLAQVARYAARRAGELIVERLGAAKNVETKASIRDLVTEVDREVEDLLHRLLSRSAPGLGWLGEESDLMGKRSWEPHKTRWIVDPIDGTTNFVHGIPLCSVSIALYEGLEGLLGLVYDPFRDELFLALRGAGATLNGQPISCQKTRRLERALLVTGFPDSLEEIDHNLRLMQALMHRVGKLRAFGSAALELAYVAAGRITGFWELVLSPWDVAAGTLLVREAGGTVTDLQGRDHTLESRSIMASNGLLHDELLQIMGSVESPASP